MKFLTFKSYESIRSICMLSFATCGIGFSWLETDHWGLKIISIFLLLAWAFEQSIINLYWRRNIIKKIANSIATTLKFLKPVVYKWNGFDLFELSLLGLQIYFAWMQTTNTGLRLVSILSVVSYLLCRVKETL